MFLDLLFPIKCQGCGKEGDYLCDDCLALFDFAREPARDIKEINSLYFAVDYNNPMIKKLLHSFKYAPFAKDLSCSLSSVIITYFKLMEKKPPFLEKENFCFVPIPLSSKRLRWRGFNQSEEIAKILSAYYAIPMKKALIKTKETKPQTELNKEQRKKNLIDSFEFVYSNLKQNENVVLVDDVITTGSTLSEAAKALRKAGVKKVYAVALARD